jgi:hypothetical protein
MLRGALALSARRLLLLLSPAVVCGAPLRAAGQDVAVAPGELQLVEHDLKSGEKDRLRIGSVAGMVNLDPEVVRVEELADGILVEGLRPGTATIRVWDARGGRVVRVRVAAARPAPRSAEGRVHGSGPGLSFRGGTHAFARSGSPGMAGDPVVLTQDAGVAWEGTGSRATGEAWVELRQGEPRLPHALVTLEMRGTSVELGTVPLAWSPYTFYRDRIVGGRMGLTLPKASGAPGWSLEAALGADAPDFVTMGSRLGPLGVTGGGRGGLRAQWHPSESVVTHAEIGIAESSEGAVGAVGAVGARGSMPALDVEGLVGFDGSRIAMRGTARAELFETVARLSGEVRQSGFTRLRSGMHRYESRRFGAGLSRDFGDRLSLSATTSRSWSGLPEIEGEPAAIDIGNHGLTGTVSLGTHAALATDLRLTLQDMPRARWRRWRGGLSLVVRDLDLPGGAKLGGRLGVADQRDRARGGIEGDYAWEEVRLAPAVRVTDWLRADGAVALRLSGPDATESPRTWTWEGRLVARVPAPKLFVTSHFGLGYREWEVLSTGTGRFVRGGHLTATLSLKTRSWRGFFLESDGTWSYDPLAARGTGAIHGALVYGASARSTPGPDALLPVRARVRGLVFHDADGDGQRDLDEVGIAGARVRLDDGREAVTRSNGSFSLRVSRGSKGQVRVVDGYDPALEPTTPEVQAAQVGRIPLLFGLGPRPATLEVLAFNDFDGNGQRGPEEPLVPGVVLRMEGESLPHWQDRVLRTRGATPLRRVLPSGGEVRGEWAVDTLPTGYQPVDVRPLTVRPGPDETVRWTLALTARRTIEGRVHLDANGNGNGGRPGVEGVVVRAGTRHAISDASGRYVLLGLPYGTVEVTVVEGAPEGWTAPLPVPVELGPAPAHVRGIDLALHAEVD